jgi:dethiobiotin synthetase
MKQSGIFVTGTDTDVGKTWVGRMIIRQLIANGIKVIPRKPVESGWQDNEPLTDAGILAKAAGVNDLQKVCPNRFRAAVSPVRAATLEGHSLSLQQVYQQCLEEVTSDNFLYVEGAGGFFSPLVNDPNSKGLNADLAKQLDLPVLLVAEDRLGCINQVLLTLSAIQAYQLPIIAVVLNRLREGEQCGCSPQSEMNNIEDLKTLINVPIYHLKHDQREIDDELIEVLSVSDALRTSAHPIVGARDSIANSTIN